MGVLVDGQICFGVQFAEGYEFPWFCEKYDFDIEAWWFNNINDFKPPFPYHHSLPKEKKKELLDYRKNFEKQHPLPVKPVNYCSSVCPIYILAVPKTVLAATKKHPEIFYPENLKVSDEDVQKLLQFCEKFELKFEFGPAWFLSCFHY